MLLIPLHSFVMKVVLRTLILVALILTVAVLKQTGKHIWTFGLPNFILYLMLVVPSLSN